MHDSSTCPICGGFPIGGSLSDEKFFEFLAVCRDELVQKQSRFLQRLGDAESWSYELLDSSITFGSERFPMTPVGTHSPQYQTWLWAWANEDFPSVARDASRQLQALHERTGFQVFLDRGLAASSADAQDFVALAVHHLGAIGFFRSPSDGPTLYIAVHDNEDK